MRLDKLLSHTGYGTRKDVKILLKKKRVMVDDKVIRNGSVHVNPDTQHIQVDHQCVHYKKYIYLMMNKAAGYISATEDAREKTVIDGLPEQWKHFKPYPVGRLDKDTEGLLLLTNDGAITHALTSPKKNIEKTYYAKISGQMTDQDIERFRHGIVLDDGYVTKPARLNILTSDIQSEVELTITEGKFHQVKRMFAAIEAKVTYLKRIRMGEIVLDDQLSRGAVRILTQEEYAYLQQIKHPSK